MPSVLVSFLRSPYVSSLTEIYINSAAFHPLTNRKHHCRLCGTIICSLPIKHPQRKALCSTLFVVDSNTREIEEVGEGVDYGVRKRKTSTISGPQSRQEEEDKFLKGVRICRECRPILLCVSSLLNLCIICSPYADGSNIISKLVLCLCSPRCTKFVRPFVLLMCLPKLKMTAISGLFIWKQT